jgi:hypothetical protein
MCVQIMSEFILYAISQLRMLHLDVDAWRVKGVEVCVWCMWQPLARRVTSLPRAVPHVIVCQLSDAAL